MAGLSHSGSHSVELRRSGEGALGVRQEFSGLIPAQVYELEERDGQPHIQVSFTNCVHCKTCVIVDPCDVTGGDGMQNIDWRAPAEGGPRYQIL